MPKVWSAKDKGIPYDAVYVGRSCYGRKGSKWSNPYKIGGDFTLLGKIVKKNMTREDVLFLYKEYIDLAIKEGRLNPEELRGKDLVCWCAPEPCHADYLIELANKPFNWGMTTADGVRPQRVKEDDHEEKRRQDRYARDTQECAANINNSI